MADRTLAELHDPTGLPAGFRFLPTDEEILEYLKDKVTKKLDPSIDKYISTLKEENGICYTHPERLPGVSKDGQIRYFFHRPSKTYFARTRKRGREHTDEDGSVTRWQQRGNTQPVLIGRTVKGFKKILVFGAQWERHQYHLGNNEEKEGKLVVAKVFYLTQSQHDHSRITDSTGRKTSASFFNVCWNGIKDIASRWSGSELQASEQELPHEPIDANNDSGSCFCGSVADESIPKRRKHSQSKSDDWEGSSLSTMRALDHSPTPNQTETGGTKGQGMQAQNSINSSSVDTKNAGSGNGTGSFPQMGLPASASWPNVQQPLGSGLTDDQNAAPRGSNFTGYQNAAPRPVFPNQNSFRGQVPVNPDIGVGAHPGNQNATPRPLYLNQEPNYPGGGIGCISMNGSFNIHSPNSGTISMNNGLTNSVSVPCWANHGGGS